MKQQEAIQDELEKLRRADASLEERFDRGRHEYCFVKNLETIQGDERDVIFLSIGYGRDGRGKMSMNFGPLNQQGGARRLNVLVTRAREKVRVFSSILPEDIDPAKTQATGVLNLRTYLDYARRGPSTLADLGRPDSAPPETDFERGLSDALAVKGFDLHKKVGNSGYRIDLAVLEEDRAVMGIECDGPSYRSAATTRDRERLRRQVLEGLGWRLCRVWSADWHRSPDRELARILEQIKEGREGGAVTRLGLESVDVGGLVKTVPARGEEEITVYSVLTIAPVGEQDDFYTERTDRIGGILALVIEHEGPIHVQEASRRVAAHWGISRLGSKILEIIASAARRLERAGLISRRGDFFWPATMTEVPLRRRDTEDAPCEAELIAPEEIAAAVLLILKKEFRVPLDGLMDHAARVLGFSRAGSRVRESVAEAVRILKEAGKITESSGGIRLATSQDADPNDESAEGRT
jgi:very-short-patch-repair endonuclease